MREENKHYLDIGEHYFVGADGSLYYVEPIIKDGEITGQAETAIANHAPILKEQRLTDNGIEQLEELIFTVRRNYQMSGDIAVTLKEILSQTPTLKFGAACRIYLGKGYKSRYSEAMQIQCENAPRSTLYQRTGYAVIDGQRVFLNGENSVTAEGLTNKYNVAFNGQLSNYRFTAEKHESRFDTLLKLLPSTAPQKLIYAGLGLSFLTPLNALLRDEGIEPCFILYFTGKTGTRKTTMAKLFLNFFGSFDNGTAPPAGFRDTPNAVEKKFALTDSTLVLLDDRIPSTTPKVKAQMETMEQSVARQIGDRSGRARMNADGSLKPTYRPNCNLIITAEESFSNVGESAIARSISVELKPGDIELAALTEVQQKAGELNECMSDYIQFIIQNWDNLQAKLKPLFLELRSTAQSGGHGRLAECVAHLQIGVCSMCDWLISAGVLNEAQAAELKSRSWSVFVELAEEQNRRISEEKPVKLFLDAIKEMRDRRTIRFMSVDANTEYAGTNTVGFTDGDFYYCYPDSIYTEVRKFYAAQDKSFPLGKGAIFQQLATENLIETDKGQNTKAKRIDGKRSRFLWLRAAALDNEEENEQ